MAKNIHGSPNCIVRPLCCVLSREVLKDAVRTGPILDIGSAACPRDADVEIRRCVGRVSPASRSIFWGVPLGGRGCQARVHSFHTFWKPRTENKDHLRVNMLPICTVRQCLRVSLHIISAEYQAKRKAFLLQLEPRERLPSEDTLTKQ